MMSLLRRHAFGLAVCFLLLAVFVGVVLALGLVLLDPPWQGRPLPGEVARLSGLDKAGLDAEKLRQEILQMEIQNATSTSPWSAVLALVPLATGTAALMAVLATIWKQITDNAQQRQKAAEERQNAADELRREALRAAEERHVEAVQRFDEGFTKVVSNLGADSVAIRASAAVSLLTFLRPEYQEMHDQVLMVAVANAKTTIGQPEQIQRSLMPVIVKALRARIVPVPEADRSYLLDFSRTTLDRADLSGLDLAGADVAFASLRHVNLTHANLFRLRGIEVDLDRSRLSDADLREARLRDAKAHAVLFHDTRCVSARFENARLVSAEFFRAELQEAHFEGADLRGARFEGANLNNAFFAGAILDDSTRKSIATGALNWRKAHFDPAEAAALGRYSQDAGTR